MLDDHNGIDFGQACGLLILYLLAFKMPRCRISGALSIRKARHWQDTVCPASITPELKP